MHYFTYRPNTVMNKKQLRSTYKQRRKELSRDQIDRLSLAITNQCLKLPIWDQELFHVFLSIPTMNEVDTTSLISALMGKNKRIAVPKMIPETQGLNHYELTSDTRFYTNTMGIDEPDGGRVINPDEIDVVFVPLLAYDQKGQRVGYGKGYYDRFLSQCHGEVITVGLSFFEPENAISEIEETDVSLHYVVSPNQIFNFREI